MKDGIHVSTLPTCTQSWDVMGQSQEIDSSKNPPGRIITRIGLLASNGQWAYPSFDPTDAYERMIFLLLLLIAVLLYRFPPSAR
jgi:hypothetical protein